MSQTSIRRSPVRARLATAAAAALVAGLVGLAPSAAAVSTTLVINEVDYDQPGTDAAEFVELKNVGPTALDLSGYTLELVNGNGGGAVAYDTIALPSVTLPAGGYFVVCANAVTVTNCDLDDGPDTNFIQNGAPDGIGLRFGATVVDALSYEGDTGAPYTEGSGAGLVDDGVNAADSLSRCPDGADTDVNATDFTLRPATPGLANDCPTAGSLVINEIDYDQPSTDTAEFVELKNVGSTTIDLDGWSVVLVNGNGGAIYDTIALPAESLSAGDYFVVCANAATVANCDLDVSPDTNLIQNGSPDAVGLLNGTELVDAVSYEGDTAAPYTEGSGTGLEDDSAFTGAGISRCPDGADTNQNNVDLSFHLATPGAANDCATPPQCTSAATPIHAIQGDGASSPLAGDVVVVEGIVVGDYQQPGGFGGFYVQEEDSDADADPATSEGIFVFAPTAPDVAVGDAVTVCGTAAEFSGLTELSSVAGVTIDSSGNPLPTATDVDFPVASIDDLEAFEGMRISIDQELTVTEVFTLARFGEVALSAAGRLANPTNVVAPGAPAIALQDLNDRSRILLDDGDNQQNIDPTLYPQGGLSATNTLRVGDSLDGLTGVMDFRFGVYRVQPVFDASPIEFDHTNPRPAAPPTVGGDLRVASLNVLNYFTTLDTGSPICGPSGGLDCRGANSAFELERQRTKILAALEGLNADIVGLTELENNATASLADIVAGLNADLGAGTYAYVDTGTIGTDAIKVGLVYRPAAVAPVGSPAIIDHNVDARFRDDFNRPSLAQTFEAAGGGGRLTVVVNHLKSKGSDCNAVGDPDTGDGQGNCNVTRTMAAEALVDWLATDPTGSGDRDVLLIGDMNSYAKEDPITVFRDAGFTDLHQAFEGADAYSYVFQGQSGYLDHALASPTLAAQVTGAGTWHINPDEPVALDYNVDFKTAGQVTSFYDPGPYRSSDHDPVLEGIALADLDPVGLLAPIGSGTTAKAGQTRPIQFSLGGDFGLDILFQPAQVFACSDWPGGPSSDAESAGASGLSYDSTTDRYTFAWKTAKAWVGSCKTIEVTFRDGSYLAAEVEFVR